MLLSFARSSTAALALAASAAWAQGPFQENFVKLDSKLWNVANYEFSHPMFDTDWSNEQVSLDNGLILKLSPQKGRKNQFLGASVRRHETTGFGRYETVMQPAKGKGLITGFFTYTGPYYGDPHDEIDIEFMGKDTTMMHVAWFVDGKLYERNVPLGFDASDRPRAYAFEWVPDAIRWYAEGKLIFEITGAEAPIPQTPGMLFANIWAADESIKNWAGLPQSTLNAEAKVVNIGFTPAEPLVFAGS